MRTVVVHYHIFKNAGTSLDTLLKFNYGDRWGQIEAPPESQLQADFVFRHLKEHPEIEALSSHTALMTPTVERGEIRLFPLVLLRNPLDRIRSAYDFERRQPVETGGARKAKEVDFAGYVQHFLERPGDRRFRNFQLWKISQAVDGEPALEFQRGLDAVETLPWVGVVEAFDDSVRLLQRRLAAAGTPFKVRRATANASNRPKLPLRDLLADLRDRLGADLYHRVLAANMADWALWERAWRNVCRQTDDAPAAGAEASAPGTSS